jgi:hypothetical protein
MFCCGLLPELTVDRLTFGQIAFVGYLPFVVGFDENPAGPGSGQAQNAAGLGKTPTTSVRRLISY